MLFSPQRTHSAWTGRNRLRESGKQCTKNAVKLHRRRRLLLLVCQAGAACCEYPQLYCRIAINSEHCMDSAICAIAPPLGSRRAALRLWTDEFRLAGRPLSQQEAHDLQQWEGTPGICAVSHSEQVHSHPPHGHMVMRMPRMCRDIMTICMRSCIVCCCLQAVPGAAATRGATSADTAHWRAGGDRDELHAGRCHGQIHPHRRRPDVP